ncbi:MAG: helix-turn-helix transcriptional regulator [Gemmatimonadales bacterium]|nr:helix-turn-helix transcriptional regulator [Gemmatimonadales bacterium]
METQAQLADRVGLARGYLSGVERGTRNISVLKLRTLALALGVEVARLVPRNNPPKSRPNPPVD